MEEINCRGLACPIPVLKTKEALERGAEEIAVIVDNRASKENVRRFAEKMGCSVEVEERGKEFILRIRRREAVKEEKNEERKGSYCVFITGSSVGEDRELGKILMKGFVKTFLDADPPPSKVVLINTAVKLACRGSDPEILEALKELKRRGVDIICCGTCLDYFNLLDELEVGVASNAYEVVQTLIGSEKIVRL